MQNRIIFKSLYIESDLPLLMLKKTELAHQVEKDQKPKECK